MKTKIKTKCLEFEQDFHMGIFDYEYLKPRLDQIFKKKNNELTSKITNILAYLYAPLDNIPSKYLDSNRIIAILREYYCDTIAFEAVRMALAGETHDTQNIYYNINGLIYQTITPFAFDAIINETAIVSAIEQTIIDAPHNGLDIISERFSRLNNLVIRFNRVFESDNDNIQQRIFEILSSADCLNSSWHELHPFRITINFKSQCSAALFNEIASLAKSNPYDNLILSSITSEVLIEKLKQALYGKLLIRTFKMSIEQIPHSTLYPPLNNLNSYLDSLSQS